MSLLISRRRLFGIGAAFGAAPAIVRVGSIMPVSVVKSANFDVMQIEFAVHYDSSGRLYVGKILKMVGCEVSSNGALRRTSTGVLS